MHRTAIRLLVTAAVLVVGIVAPLLVLSAGPVAADCESNYYFIDQPPDVQGTTFVGTYLGRDTSATPGTDSFRVSKVYAGDPAETITYDVQPCHPFRHLSKGEAYLVSTSEIMEPTARNTVVYRLLAGSGVRLIGLDGPAQEYIPIWRLDRLADVLALVAPGSLPSTDRHALPNVIAGGPFEANSLAILMGIVGLAGAMVARRRFGGETPEER